MGLKEELVQLAKEMGAANARITTTERLAGPPSADPTYILPGARSVIAFAVVFDRTFIPEYFGKVSRLGFKYEMYRVYQLIGTIGGKLADYLTARGFRAVSYTPNADYRMDVTKPGFQVPKFSHRYAALASGLAAQGWSGNILLPGTYAAALYGSAVTDAEIEPDEPLTEEICDKCKMCTLVCPTGFFSAREEQTTVLGGREYTSGKKRGHTRCGISCAGLTGLSQNGKWSSWSTGRLELPEDDAVLPAVFAKAARDPANAHIIRHVRPQVREGQAGMGVLARSLQDTDPTCCNCCLVCSGPREWREKLVKLMHTSGTVGIRDGKEVVTGGDPDKSRTLFLELKL